MNRDLLKPFFIKNKPFTVQDFARECSFTHEKSSFLLSLLVRQNHLIRLKRGVYLPVSHKGLTPQEAFSAPFVVVPLIFPHSYVGGWTMASYWGLTEQLFQTVVVLTEKDVHIPNKVIGRYNFNLFKSHLPHTLGIEFIWKENQQVLVSDIHRTIIDMIENPRCGGGIQHTIDCAKVYFKEEYNEEKFMTYVTPMKNGVFFKRLGFISERIFGVDHPLCQLSKKRMTKGPSPIDSHLTCEKLIGRWNLYINEEIDI